MSIEKKNLLIKIGVIIVVLASCLISGRMQLNRKVEKLETVFLNGENNDQLSVHYDLVKIDDSLGYFLSLSKKNNVTSDSVTVLEKLHKEFDSLKMITEYNEWYQKIKQNYPIAINEVKEIALSHQHSKMLSKYEATYNSAIHTIYYSPFNQLVNEYNEETDGIIASTLKNMTGIKKVVTFD